MARYAKRRRDGTLELRLPPQLRDALRSLMRQLDDLLDTASEYRRFTESELEGIQRARVAVVLDGLAESSRITLAPDDAEAWLGALNDGRLVVASRLGIDVDEWRPGADTPSDLLFAYELLSVLFGDMLSAVTGD